MSRTKTLFDKSVERGHSFILPQHDLKDNNFFNFRFSLLPGVVLSKLGLLLVGSFQVLHALTI